MPGCPRSDVFNPHEVGVFHCYTRCTRRAFLCGFDEFTGRDFSHRRGMIQGRLELLASVFAIDVLDFSVMQNHLHVVLRNRPDLVRGWADDEVARRWLTLSAKSLELRAEPRPEQIQAALANPETVAEWRERLSHLSWFMAMLDESIARRCNFEDQCRGHFWEERYKCQALISEEAVLACAVYVNLNPIRARLAETPETAQYTSLFERIADLVAQRPALSRELPSEPLSPSTPALETEGTTLPRSGWLAPVAVEGDGYAGAAEGRRASDKGYLPITLEQFIELVDWTGREVRADKAGAIPAHLAPIFERLGLRSENWLDTVQQFGRRFGPVVGRAAQVRKRTRKSGRRWRRGLKASPFKLSCRCMHGPFA
jgi:REP element-mobilizing transposase RayT